MKFIDLTGKKFNKLTVLEIIPRISKKERIFYKCQCDCGNIINVMGLSISSNNTKSCGCFQKEQVAKFSKKHGLINTSLYSVWQNMKNRCYNLKSPSYRWYGHRGITICDEWKTNFINFYNWSINNGYKESLTIDRIDSNQNYNPINCQWISKSENSQKSKRSNNITYKGETLNITKWSKKLNISNQILRDRLNKLFWTIEEAFETPYLNKEEMKISVNNKILQNTDLIISLYKKGNSIEKISKKLKVNRDLINKLLLNNNLRTKNERTKNERTGKNKFDNHCKN